MQFPSNQTASRYRNVTMELGLRCDKQKTVTKSEKETDSKSAGVIFNLCSLTVVLQSKIKSK